MCIVIILCCTQTRHRRERSNSAVLLKYLILCRSIQSCIYCKKQFVCRGDFQAQFWKPNLPAYQYSSKEYPKSTGTEQHIPTEIVTKYRYNEF